MAGSPRTSDSPQAAFSQAVRLMVIEDDEDTLANLCDILELDGYDVVAARSLQEAMSRGSWSDLDAIVLDRRLPDGTADAVLPQLKQMAPQAPVIVITGYADLEGAIRALRLGAADYLIKPVDASDLRQSVRRLVGQAVTERQLREEREFAARIFETAQAIILVLDTDGRIVRFNPFMEEVSGYRLEEVRGRDWFETFLPQSDWDRIRKVFQRALANEPIRGQINPILTRDGRERIISWYARTLTDAEGRITGVLSVGHDVTEQQEAQARLVQAERLAAIGQMVAGLAHESRNALQRSQAALEMLARRVAGNSEAMQLVQRIQRAQDDLHKLYEEVRAYASPMRLQRESCELAPIVAEAWSDLEALQRGRSARLDTSRLGSWRCRLDPFRITQVFRNIFDNALTATDGDVRVSVECDRIPTNEGPFLSIRIRDDGPGLDAEQRKRIFDPFYTTKTHGTGLGMAIVRRIVEAHGGMVEVGDCSAGTEICLTLPVEARPAPNGPSRCL